MKLVTGLPGLFMCFCWAQQPVQNVPVKNVSQGATVSVTASTTFGEPVGPVGAILSATRPEARYTQYGKAIKFEHIPFGLYDLEVQAAGFNTRRERVAVYQTEVQV